MIVYRNATVDDMASVAKTHIDCFKGYFLSSLGEQLLEKYYLEFLIENDLFIVAEDQEKSKKLYRSDIADNEKVLIDVKGLYSVSELKKSGLSWWRL